MLGNCEHPTLALCHSNTRTLRNYIYCDSTFIIVMARFKFMNKEGFC